MRVKNQATVADALLHALVSPNVPDSNLEAANVVDVGAKIGRACRAIAVAIAPVDGPQKLADGSQLTTLTEAVGRMADGIEHVASAIADLAVAVKERGQP